MDALVESLLALEKAWDQRALDGPMEEDLAIRKCSDELRSTLDKHRVGAWA